MTTPEDSFPLEQQPSAEAWRADYARRFIERTEQWVQDAGEVFAQQGVPFSHEVPVVRRPDLSPPLTNTFWTVPKIDAYCIDLGNTAREGWQRLTEHFGLSISQAALHQISVERAQRFFAALGLPSGDKGSLLVIKSDFMLGYEQALEPHTEASLRHGFYKALWMLLEAQHGIVPAPDLQPGVSQFVANTITGRSSAWKEEDSPGSIYALETRYMASLIADSVAGLELPLPALLESSVRQHLREQHEHQIAPVAKRMDEEYFRSKIGGEDPFPWLAEEVFRPFRAQPSMETFAECLEGLGYTLFAQELVADPKGEALVQHFIDLVEKGRQESQATPAEIVQMTELVRKALDAGTSSDLERGRLAAHYLLFTNLEIRGLIPARGGAQFKLLGNIPVNIIPDDLRELYELGVQVEETLDRIQQEHADALAEVQLMSAEDFQSLRDRMARLIEEGEAGVVAEVIYTDADREYPEYLPLEVDVRTVLDYWDLVQEGDDETAQSLVEGFAGESHEVSAANVERLLAELQAFEGELVGKQAEYDRKLRALLAHLNGLQEE